MLILVIGGVVYDVNFARKLCQRIGVQQESEKVRHMLLSKLILAGGDVVSVEL